MISYVLKAARDGKQCIRILSDDTDIFVLLVFLVWKAGLVIPVQMEKWNGVVLYIMKLLKNLEINVGLFLAYML